MADEPSGAVWRVPAPHAGRAVTPGITLIRNGLFLLQVALIFVSSFVPSVLGFVAGRTLFPNDRALSFLPILAGLGVTVLLMWLWFGQLLRNPWSSRYVQHKIRSEFLRRPDPVVDPNHPDAILVEVIPRRNWGQVMLDNAEDQGFLFVDSERRQLLFEGDQQRYRIPAEAILSCAVEAMNKDSEDEHHSVPVAAVVVSFRDDRLGEREVPFLPRRTVAGDTLGANYVERARELDRRIAALLSE
jgi:hypothetical protein